MEIVCNVSNGVGLRLTQRFPPAHDYWRRWNTFSRVTFLFANIVQIHYKCTRAHIRTQNIYTYMCISVVTWVPLSLFGSLKATNYHPLRKLSPDKEFVLLYTYCIGYPKPLFIMISRKHQKGVFSSTLPILPCVVRLGPWQANSSIYWESVR